MAATKINFDSATVGALPAGLTNVAVVGSTVATYAVTTTGAVSQPNALADGAGVAGPGLVVTGAAASADHSVQFDQPVQIDGTGKGGGCGVLLRSTADGRTCYVFVYDFASSAPQPGFLFKIVGGTPTQLAMVPRLPSDFTNGQVARVRASCSGTTFSLWVWPPAQAQPSTPLYSGQDGSITAGYPGVYSLTNGGGMGSTRPTLDNLWYGAPGDSFADTTPTPTPTPTPTLATIAVTPTNQSIPGGGSQQYVATGTMSDGSTVDLTNSATWSEVGPGSINLTGLLSTPASNSSVQSGTVSAALSGKTGSTGYTVPATAPAPLAVAPNLSDAIPTGATSAIVSVAAPSGGSGTYSYAWHLSTQANFAPSSATLVAGESGRVATFSGLTPGTVYHALCVVSDGSTTATTFRRPVVVSGLAPLRALRIGDSTEDANASTPSFPDWINGQPGPPSRHMASILRSRLGPRAVAIVNRAISGTRTADWAAGSANLTAALAAFAAAGAVAGDWVLVRLGVNDGQSAVPAATYRANMASIVGACAGAGYKVQLDCPTWREPGQFAENTSLTFDEATTPYLLSYLPALDSLADGSAAFAGDRRSFAATATAPTAFLNRTTALPGGIHETVDGAVMMAANSASALLTNAGLQDVATAPTVASVISLAIPTGTIGVATLGTAFLTGGTAPMAATSVALAATGATVPTSVTIPAGAYSATFALTPGATSFAVTGSATGLTSSGPVAGTAVAASTAGPPSILTTAEGASLAKVDSILTLLQGGAGAPASLLVVSIDPSATVGNATTGAIYLANGVAHVGPVVVSLVGDDVTVPATVTIPAGAYSASFPMTPTALPCSVAVSAAGMVGWYAMTGGEPTAEDIAAAVWAYSRRVLTTANLLAAPGGIGGRMVRRGPDPAAALMTRAPRR